MTVASPYHPPPHHTHGFTIVELVIAMLLLAMGLVGLWGLMNATMRINEYNSQVTTATSLAEDKFESLLENGYANITTGADAVNSFSRNWTVTTGTNPDTKTITMDVSWQPSGGGASRQVHMCMIAAE